MIEQKKDTFWTLIIVAGIALVLYLLYKFTRSRRFREALDNALKAMHK